MHILHVPHAYYPVVGGTELNCRRISEVLAARGHDVHVLTTDAGAVQAYYQFGIKPVTEPDQVIGGVSVKRLKFSAGLYCAGGWVDAHMRPRRVARQVAWRMMQVVHKRLDRKVTSEIAQMRPDVVMATPHLVANVQMVLAARSRLDFPLVMVPQLHEHDPNWDVAAMANALSIAEAVVALTPHEAGRLVEAYGVPPRKIFLASVGIDIERTPVGEVDRAKRIIYFGRQVRSKGIGDLIEAMRLVWRHHPDAELAIAGVRVPESAEVDAYVAALPENWRNRVKNFGIVSSVAKADLLGSARCLVLPSKTESFGMVILDAWANATPAVTWDLPVFRNIVEHGRTGLLVDPKGGAKALADAIMQLLNTADEAVRMGSAGYRKAVSKYSWENVASVYLDAYEYAVCQAKQAGISLTRRV